MCFNSLRTGKGISRAGGRIRSQPSPSFQFPTNGKGHFKGREPESLDDLFEFQFPTNGKGHFKSGTPETHASIATGFNSLRTGKGISSYRTSRLRMGGGWFQFPTNGKGHFKRLLAGLTCVLPSKFQFPTNGKGHFKSTLAPNSTALITLVSIPYERERAFQEPPFCTQMSRGSVHPKTIRELRGAFFCQKFTPKIPRTLINTGPNAIF